MQPIFAIGDIHGQREGLEAALELIARDPAAGAPVVFTGDYVDRGPDSRGVIEMLIHGAAEGAPWIFLKGNHDRYMLGFLDDPHFTDTRASRRLDWLAGNMGGRATLASYGVDVRPGRAVEAIHADAVRAVPEAHRDWLARLKPMHVTESHVFVHAGIRPGIPLDAQSEDDLIWIRDEFLYDTRDHGRLVVHGHTPVDAPQHCGNRVNVDGGAGWGRPLTPVLLLGREAFALNAFGRARL